MEVLFGLLIIMVISGGIAEMIRTGGFWWGFFLGILGWIIAALTRNQHKTAQELKRLREDLKNKQH